MLLGILHHQIYVNNLSKAISYAVKKMVSENGFADNLFSNKIFPSTRPYLTAYQNIKGQ